MINNDKQLAIQQEQLGRLERIIEAWRAELLPMNPRNFELYAEGAIEMHDKIKAEIDDYLARKNSAPADSTPTPADTRHPTNV